MGPSFERPIPGQVEDDEPAKRMKRTSVSSVKKSSKMRTPPKILLHLAT